ncbi:M20/M25/M40 family metallo-hydrolase [Aurantiacibacter sp. MUD61]|uniref:M20/M25/M40 family metallo-hydrolase n=1 Tax=Aurantiacibacter sp. MUD61 TaxID=3009083 RepID=UPI0022F139E0|nr:M20/M25/M40 family metallo-hydrolase [Aurantiacibacter sp. MUD61]
MTRFVLASLAALSLAYATPAMAQFSPAEEAITESVVEHHEADIALLERIVNINSGTYNLEGVRAVADVLAPEFEALGFAVEWIDQSEAGRAGHLIARWEGDSDNPNILLIGHLDTVFEPESPFQTFSRDGDNAIGPGITDNKGGIIVILSALRAMVESGTILGANITVILSGDEEDAGEPLSISREHLYALGEWADIALGFEGLSVIDGRDYGVVARRSSNSWQLETTGQSGHSSGIFRESVGYGAIYEMTRILDAFRVQLPEENLTYNVGFMAGGTPAMMGDDLLSANTSGKTNIIPSTAVARGDIRTLSVEQFDRTVAAMQAIVDDNLPGTDATITFDTGYPAMAPTDGNRALLAQLNEINADLGLEPMEEFPPSRRGAADISFVALLVDQALAGMGPNGSGSHAAGESIDLTSIIRQAQRAAILMSRLSDNPRF